MKAILRTVACISVLLLTMGIFASCGEDEEPVVEQPTTTTQTTTTVATTTTQHGSLSATDVIVRSGPGLDYDAIGGVTYDEEVIILGREGDWYRIQFGDTVGYISAQYVDVDDAPNASEMVEDIKTTSTINTSATTTTTKKGGKVTTTTTKKGATTGTTQNGGTTGTTTTGTGVVTTTTTVMEGIPTVADGIPEVGIVDDF